MAWKRRSKSPFKQKPWNKVSRMEKWWVPNQSIFGTTQQQNFATTGSPNYVVFWDPWVQATRSLVTFQIGPGLQSVKIHRMDGRIAMHGVCPAWPEEPPNPPSLMTADYVWLIVDKAADTHDAGSFPATSLNPSHYSSGDLYELLQRDDILRWGSIDVPVTRPIGLFQSETGADMLGWLPRRSNLPFPRIGKMGLNIKRGKALACIVAARAIPDGGGSVADIDDGLEMLASTLVVDPTYRVLCSA